MATFEPSPDLDPKVAQAIQEAMEALRAEMRERLAPQAKAAPLGDSGGDRLSRLERAVEALDSAPSQTELLTCFLEEAGAFADRSLFLVRDEEDLKGWAAFGFSAADEDVAQVRVGCPSAVAAGQPAEEPLAADAICDQLAAVPAAGSLLIPFSLRGKVAGALYVDRSSADGVLDRSALRILSYVAAQAVETLPLRRGDKTVEATVTPAETPVEELVEEPEASWDEGAGEVATELEEPAPVDLTDPEVDMDVERMIEEVEPEATGEHDAADIVAIRQGVTPAGFETVEDVQLQQVDEAEEIPEAEEAEAAEEPSAAEEPEDEFVAAGFDTEVEDVERREFDEPEAMEPEVDVAATVETEIEEEVEEVVEVSTAQTAATAVEDAEVAPPEDLDGPGWAFSAAESMSDDNRHEEARRLARLLVTEIKLYNEEKVREGRENSDLYDQLRDDIERSRRIYEERIDDEIREGVDYFQEEVVRILAGGDSTALGA